MNRYLLLIFLSSWSSVVPLSLQCETGIAYPGHVLNIPHSLMANADVALLMTYQSEGVNGCMQDCCTEKYGSCTVVSFKKNVTENSCQHFNCRPVMKCRYLSSKMTDSFSFSSSPLPDVPSRHASKLSSSLAAVPKTTKLDEHSMKEQQELGTTKEAVATYSEEQFAMKNDNTTIKPRKGVEEFADPPESATRSGSKPRKGVTMDDVVSNSTKSKVKPRKGVGLFVSETTTTTSLTSVNELSTHSTYFSKNEHSSSSVSINSYSDAIANDLVSALEKVFEDDPDVTDVKVTSSSQVSSVESTPSYTSSVVQPSTTRSVEVSSSTEQNYTPSDLQSSFSTSYIPPTSTVTPHLEHTATTAQTADAGNRVDSQASSRSSISAEHSKLLPHELSAEASTELADSVESEKERKYKSSMHLVLSLVFGLLVLFTVMGVVAKRVYDGWMRRHYRRMDFLIDGMYHGYE